MKKNTKGILNILKEKKTASEQSQDKLEPIASPMSDWSWGKKTESEQSQDKVEPITSPMSDWSWKSEEENSN